MAVTQDKPAPYAPASAILELIRRYRDKSFPSPITQETLQRASVSDSLIPRTYQALQSLDLIDEDGKPTPTLERLRRAPETEYRDRLAEWVRSAYAEVLNYVDPETDDETRVRDQFRHYNPVGQQPRMVSLFLGLAAAAGMAGDKSAPQSRRFRMPPASLRKPAPTPREARPMVTKPPAFYGGGATQATALPAPLAGLLSSLPPEGGAWSQARRDRFVATFEAVIDFCYRVEEDASSPGANQDQAQEEEDA